MAKQITDDEDRLKRQARRRIIGAVALTTAIVVVLPMVLDSEPKPVGQDIELRIPDKDKIGVFTPKIDLPSASASLTALPASSVAAVSAPSNVSVPMPQVSVVPVAAVATPEIKVASSPATLATAVTDHKSEQTRPEAKPEQAKHDSKTAQSPQETKSGHAKAAVTAHTEQGQPVPKTGFSVQLGAFANADTAHSWQKNLIQQGFKAYTEKIGDKVRVRVGPFSTREAANKARHKLEVKGLHANIVELD